MSERAKQFLSFAALRGYYDMVREGSKVIEPKRSLSDEELQALNEAAAKLKKGVLISIVFYEDYGYTTLEGRVDEFCPDFRRLKIGKKRIDFSEVLAIQILGTTPKDEDLA